MCYFGQKKNKGVSGIQLKIYIYFSRWFSSVSCNQTTATKEMRHCQMPLYNVTNNRAFLEIKIKYIILGDLEDLTDLSGSTSRFGMLLVNYSALYFIKCHM